MKSNSIVLLVFHFLFLFLGESSSPSHNGVYVVYMGAADSRNASLRSDHAHILNLVLRRNDNALVRNYKHGFSGFAARLSKEDAASIAQKPGVVSVFPDPILKLHTTRSWDFLEYDSHVIIDSDRNTLSNSSSSSDIVIGIIDTGIWPEAASFSDKGMNPVPSHWNGTCMASQDFNSSNCNRKLIGARYYPSPDGDATLASSVRDSLGHGTHTASTAAGSTVSVASYYGLAEGTARGGFPESRLAVYKVCSEFGCRGSSILAAFDDAIADGVDILSLSLGASALFHPDLMTDPIAVGAFHAVERGIMVVCSAGNDGPDPNTVVNAAPWILTVAATTIDRDFQSNVVLGGNKVVKGEAINFSPLSSSPEYPLIYSETVKKSDADIDEARQCHPDSLDESKVKGKIILCNGESDTVYSPIAIADTVKEAGGLGLVHITPDQNRAIASKYGDFPATTISTKDATTILQYVNSTSNPVATILPTVSVINYKPAPMMTYFSSRGPSTLSKNILKPDIAAPGVNILAAWLGNSTEEVPKGKTYSPYNIISGTSMSCPHVSGFAGRLKSLNPTWSASAIRSAIMTSATQINNMKTPIATDSGSLATPYDYGAGFITASGPLQPGLVYETSTTDYLNFLCYIGLNTTTVMVISRTVPTSFSCPKDSSSDLISNINYPSISISDFNKKGGAVNVSRTVTNVGEVDEIEYSAAVDAPSGLNVKVIPDKLKFTKTSKTLSYQVTFSLTSTSLKEDLFGSITWSSDKYTVRSPFVLAK
ncbi:PREDICTED: CO(2)-response secreted protease [Lupinus angustifolius]|uniref:CO(2)-response secreted protease n=1 Tax=Lupinus angustifolius TaxID=3871 RepID=UPI00092F8474|nr:PREDICTED: CO(2)-response secreted protease [Lupinus angustifolius]